MKSKITEEIKEIFTQSINWAKLEVEYIKLTASEKLIILLSAILLGGIFMILLIPVFFMLMLALAEVFIPMMPAAVAYVVVAGIFLVLIILLYIGRKPLIYNPMAKFISKLLLERGKNETKE